MQIRRFAITLALILTPFASVAEDGLRSVSVDGIGRVAAVPDMAAVSIGVTREAREAGAAMAAASDAMTSVLAEIAATGIPTEDVQTTRVGLDPRWRHAPDGSAPRVVGYIASNTLSVKVRDMSLLGGLLDSVVSEGANSMNGLSFEIADTRMLEDAARLAAVEDAARKAGMLAAAAGAELGEVISISEGRQGGGPVPMFEAADAMRATVPVAAGQIEIVVTVRAVYALTGG